MKKHLLTRLFMLMALFVSVGTFNSCNDLKEEDLAYLEKNDADLKAIVDDLQTQLSNIKQYTHTGIDISQEMWDGVLADIKALQSAPTQAEADSLKQVLKDHIDAYNQLASAFDKLSITVDSTTNVLSKIDINALDETEVTINGATYKGAELEKILPAIQAVIGNLQAALTTAQQDIADLTKRADGIDQQIVTINSQIAEVNGKLARYENSIAMLEEDVKKGVEAYNWMATAKEEIKTIQETVAKLATKDYVDSINTELQTQINDVNADLTALENKLEADSILFEGKFTTLTSDLATLGDRATANEQAIKAIEKKLQKIMGVVNRVEKMVTSVIVQGTDNPVFGTLSLPLGIQSNVLMTWYGESENGFSFPSSTSLPEYNSELVITETDMQMLQSAGTFESYEVAQGAYLMETGEGNAGMVYMTINPTDADLEGLEVTLVNSQDEESGVKLSAIEKSDKVLTLGYTRAANNGFYQAKATLAPEDIEKVKVDIEPGLKDAVVNALSMTKGDSTLLVDLANLAQILYRQFDGILPANGIKATYQYEDSTGALVTGSTYSNYNMAATAMNPLSFKFFYDESLDTVPLISPLTDFQFDLSKFEFDVDFPVVWVDASRMNIVLKDIAIRAHGTLEIELQLEGEDTSKTYTITGNSQQELYNDLAEQINSTMGYWEDHMNYKIYDALNRLMSNISTQIIEALDAGAGSISQNLSELVAEINAQINSALGGYVDSQNSLASIYNQAVSSLNSVLKNPNHYLQVMMVYETANGTYNILSTDPDIPTVMTLDGGTATTLFPTTYSGEILAPAYKKFVGVTNVWSTADSTVSAVNGDATCQSLLKLANSSSNLVNRAVTGQTRRVPFAVGEDANGHTYEIVYSALDYAGYTSTQKYYITVK